METSLPIATLKRSRTARLLSLLVATVLFIVQMVFIVPLSINRYSLEVSELVSFERSRIDLALRYNDPETLEVDSAILSESVVGVVLRNEERGTLFAQGQTAGAAIAVSKTSNSALGRIRQVNWKQQTLGEPIDVRIWVDLGAARTAGLLSLLVMMALALVASAVGAIVALVGTNRYYIRPIDELIASLRVSRENSEGRVPDIIAEAPSTDLKPLTDEFNSLIEEQKKASRQIKVKQQYLEFAAHHDPLTQLPNRALYEQEMLKTARAALTSDARFAVFLVDLDNFKFFNDQHGHLVGDKMLAEVGNRLRNMMRDVDLVARLDGDEFVVLQRDVADRNASEEVAMRIMKVCTAPFDFRGLTLKPAVSVGISCYPADSHDKDDEDLLGEEMLNNASVALQAAKSSGKNQYQLFNEEMRSRATARIRLEQDIKLALQHKQFELFYQPKVSIATREVIGAEALIRWRHPVNGFISPEAFVPVAEEAGLIIELGDWILQTACEQTMELHAEGLDGLSVAVNISAVQFTDKLVPTVNQTVEQCNYPANYLELEITESAVMNDPEQVIETLHVLHKCGYRLAIDDFGTGYSSLAYLKRFPVDTLKVDRAFITDVSTDTNDVAIVEAVLGLARHFGMKVVAEGVESEEQMNFLKERHCDIAQGYYISKPMSFSEYRQWLQRWPYGIQGRDSGDSKVEVLQRRTGT